jgi:hypothetical protein
VRRHFLTIYFDPRFYGDLYIHPNKPEYNYDTNLFAFLRRRSSEPSYADRLGIGSPIERIQHSIAEAVAQVQRFIWKSWGTGGGDPGEGLATYVNSSEYCDTLHLHHNGSTAVIGYTSQMLWLVFIFSGTLYYCTMYIIHI